MESSGFGAVIRNNMGAVMVALFQEVVVEGDNANVIRGLAATSPDKSMLGNIYEDAPA